MRLSFSAAALALIATTAFAQSDLAQTSEVSKPWFGVHLPPSYGAEPAVRIGERLPRAAVVPAGEAAFEEFRGATIRKDLERIVAFSDESRATREIGSGQ